MRQRKNLRLQNYDYSQNGYYFVTICVCDRKDALGEIVDGRMVLNECGNIVENEWKGLGDHYGNCRPGRYVIMLNHIHGIIMIQNDVGTGFKPVPTRYSLSEMVRGFKTFSSRKINQRNHDSVFRWQRSFYDHVVRNERSLHKIYEYMDNNPLAMDMKEIL